MGTLQTRTGLDGARSAPRLVKRRAERHTGIPFRPKPSTRRGQIVLTAGPSARVRGRWRAAFEPKVGVYEVADRTALEQGLADLRPGFLLLDLALCQPHVVRSVTRFRRLSPSTKIVLFAGQPQEGEGIAALKAGARGYCPRRVAPFLLKKAIERIKRGEIWIGRKAIANLLDELTSLTDRRRNELGSIPGSPDHPRSRLASLTRREREIAHLLGAGVSNKEIAGRLHVTEKTVKAHLTIIFRKLGLSNRLQAALLVAAAQPSTA